MWVNNELWDNGSRVVLFLWLTQHCLLAQFLILTNHLSIPKDRITLTAFGSAPFPTVHSMDYRRIFIDYVHKIFPCFFSPTSKHKRIPIRDFKSLFFFCFARPLVIFVLGNRKLMKKRREHCVPKWNQFPPSVCIGCRFNGVTHFKWKVFVWRLIPLFPILRCVWVFF